MKVLQPKGGSQQICGLGEAFLARRLLFSQLMVQRTSHFWLILLLFLALFTTLAPPLFAEELKTIAEEIHLHVGQEYPLDGLGGMQMKAVPEDVLLLSPGKGGGPTLLKALRPGRGVLSGTIPGDPQRKSFEIPVSVENAETQGRSDPQPGTRTSGTVSPALSLRQIGQSLEKIPGIRVLPLISGETQKLLVQGEVLSRKGYQNFLFALHQFPDQIMLTASVAPGIKESLLEQASTLFLNLGLRSVNVSSAGNRFFLEGSVATPQELELAFETAQGVFPNLINRVALPIRIDPTVTVRIYLLELSRQAHEVLGLSWPGMTANAGFVSPKFSAFSPSWAISLKHLTTNGEAKVLAEPFLSVKSGSSATLTAGGEIPIRITGQFDNRVAWKHYGIKIELSIGGVAGKYIRAKIATESSQLDDASAVDGIPGIRSNTMSTEVDALVNSPIFLTGVFQSENSKDIEKIPILGDIPILGELFKSRRYRNRETELLIAFVPSFGVEHANLPAHPLSRPPLKVNPEWKILD